MKLRTVISIVAASLALNNTALARDLSPNAYLKVEIGFGQPTSATVANSWSLSFGTLLRNQAQDKFGSLISSAHRNTLNYLTFSNSAQYGLVLSAFSTPIAQYRSTPESQQVIESVVFANGATEPKAWWAKNWWIPVTALVATGLAVAGSSDSDDDDESGANEGNDDGPCVGVADTIEECAGG